MKTVEKIEDQFPITAIFDAVDLSSSTWYYHQKEKVEYEEKYEQVIENIKQVIRDHPEYGYPKIKRELDRSYEESAGFGVVRKLLDRIDLKISRNARKGRENGYRKAVAEAGKEVNLIKSTGEIEELEVMITDFTEITYDGNRLTAKLMPIVGYRCKMIFGWAIGRRADTELAHRALEGMINTLEKNEIDPAGMIFHHDQDPVYTGSDWADRILHELDMRISYSANGAKGNTVMESTIGHFKRSALNRFDECKGLGELESVVEEQVNYWNRKRMHSSLDYQTPEEFLENSL